MNDISKTGLGIVTAVIITTLTTVVKKAIDKRYMKKAKKAKWEKAEKDNNISDEERQLAYMKTFYNVG
ncbi:hypothetical protein KAR91_15960 [Candidatus Pacearchaeota archaeon]|nr:hypothetical protein [Candidatus Pacearchaeota archaeon]